MVVAARIASIQLCPGHREQMRLVGSATLLQGVGLEGDKHASPASQRQVLLADKQDLDDLGLEPGTIKENVTVEGLAVMKLEPGTRLRLGDRAVLEVNKVCEPCFRMDEIRDGLRLELDGRRGMMTTVVEGGAIRVGDPIVVLEREELAS